MPNSAVNLTNSSSVAKGRTVGFMVHGLSSQELLGITLLVERGSAMDQKIGFPAIQFLNRG